MGSYSRKDRLADHLKKIIDPILRNNFNPVGLGLMTITNVKMSSDFRLATVYISFINNENNFKNTSIINLTNKLRVVINKASRCSNPTGRTANILNKAIKFVKMGNVRKAEKIIKPAIDYLIKVNCKKIILGCTELPIAIFAFKSFKKAKKSKIFIDPNLILANTCVDKYKAA